MRFPVPAAAATLVGALLLAGCSTGPADETEAVDGGAGSADSGAFPVTIEHAYGETTIDAEPTRVVTVGWSDADFVVDLGVVPVGVPLISWGGNGEGSTDWFDEALAEIDGETPTQYDDADGVPVDEIAALEPDLILGTNSGLTKAEYTKLSRLADVVAYPDQAWGTPWHSSLEMIGQALGRSDRAAELQQETEAAIEAAREDHPELAGKSAAWGWVSPTDLSTFGLYLSLDNRPRMLEELGMETAEIVTELSEDSTSFSASVSAERAEDIDADVLVYYPEGVSEQKLLSHPLLSRIPALERGSYVAADDDATVLPLSSPTTLSLPVALETFVPDLAAAAAKAE